MLKLVKSGIKVPMIPYSIFCLKTKLNQARKFLGEGDRVRFVMRLRGREAAYKDRWCTLLRKELEELLDAATISLMPQAEGRAVVAQMDPK